MSPTVLLLLVPAFFISTVHTAALLRRYDHSAALDDRQVTLFWSLSDHSIAIAAQSHRKSGYLAIGFGDSMVNARAYVGWIDSAGYSHVGVYWIDGRDPSGLHSIAGNLTVVSCDSEAGVLSFEICDIGGFDTAAPAKIIWAMGDRWSEDSLGWGNMHSYTSDRAVRLLLKEGYAAVPPPALLPLLAVHGFFMFVAWGGLLPAGVAAARYHWCQQYHLPLRLQLSGSALALFGFLIAAAALRGFVGGVWHSKFGLFSMVLLCAQVVVGVLRPQREDLGESKKKKVWEWVHAFKGMLALIAGVIALVSGTSRLGKQYDSEICEQLTLAVILWVLIVVFFFIYLEFLELRRRSWPIEEEENDKVEQKIKLVPFTY